MARFFILTTLFVLLFPPRSTAQFLAGIDHHLPVAGQKETDPDASFTRFSVHYQTRLARVRLEFLPGIHYQKYWSQEVQSEAAGLILPIILYPMDFVNDCDCPTFSKKGQWFKKGFFFKITPAWSHFTASGESPSSFFSTGIGGGIDWGISDFVTLSPFLGYEFQSSSDPGYWPPHYANIGFQLLFRPDYRRRTR